MRALRYLGTLTLREGRAISLKIRVFVVTFTLEKDSESKGMVRRQLGIQRTSSTRRLRAQISSWV